MLPIYITAGTERYVLARRGTKTIGEPLRAVQARALLEALLRRGDPQLLLDLARNLRIDEDDPEELATELLARLASGGLLGGDMELRQVPLGEARAVHEPKEEAPEEEAEPEEIDEEPPEEEEEEVERTNIRISVFFDGTANNRANTRAANAKAARAGKTEEEFEDDETNVSRLEMMCRHDPNFEHRDSIYVEGIGTRDGWWNDPVSMGTGMGTRGVVAKVKRGAKLLLEMIDGFSIESDTIITELQVDSFGFSRGAAAARHFIHYILEEDPIKAKIEALGLTIEKVQINFVGVFDTVASIGVNHDDDSDQLRMDAVTNALQVVHLTAAEEYREKFRLTNIASLGTAQTELFLPGVHSDIGGGYPLNSHEKKWQLLDIDQFSDEGLKARFERERKWLVEDTGWYTDEQVLDPNWWNELKANRGPIDGRFNRIPLKLMADFAAESGLTWGPIATRFEVPQEELGWIQQEIIAYAAEHRDGRTSTPNHWIDRRDDEYKKLRNGFLHFSARYGKLGMAPQWDSRGIMNGERTRIIQSDVPSSKAGK